MKNVFIIALVFLSPLISSISCKQAKNSVLSKEKNEKMEKSKIKITVNSKVFSASLVDNNSANEFKKRLPLTIKMNELNSNEKYYDFSESLPKQSANPGTIQNGDLMLYGSKTLVLFYKTFSTSYYYTKLGKVDNVEGLSAALGSGNVTIKFEEY